MSQDRDLPVPRNIGRALLLHGRVRDQPTDYEVQVTSHNEHCERHSGSQVRHHYRFLHVVPEGAAGVTESGTGTESGGREFALVVFRLANNLNILDNESMMLLLACVSLTMVTTPFLKEMGG